MNNKFKILNYLGKNLDKKFTMHELSSLLDIPYASFYRTIQDMSELLVKEKAGKSTLIAINLRNKIIASFLAVSSWEERKEQLKKKPIINKLANELNTEDIVILFGSYAKGTATERSDIDILVINKKGDRSISFSKYELLFKKKINPIFVTKQEFKLMLKEKGENVGKQALKSHIILNNSAKFWEVVTDAVQ